ncbi:hypothetical protein AKG34_19490 [Peribacillus butanolivorans]|nr:hypothetical protein AKG34_19490 [Peribacillus butanolivorans]
MLSKHNSIQRDQLEMITLDQLVPANHLVRKIEGAIDFTFIYDLVKEMYSEIGRQKGGLFMALTHQLVEEEGVIFYLNKM